MYADLSDGRRVFHQKMKILGGVFSVISITNSIQSRKYLRDGGREGKLHISDGDANLLNLNRSDDGRWLNTNYDKPDNRWDREYGFGG
jgi:hypothetical protein